MNIVLQTDGDSVQEILTDELLKVLLSTRTLPGLSGVITVERDHHFIKLYNDEVILCMNTVIQS